MKKISFLGIAVAAAMGFSSCQKDNLADEPASPKLIKETFTASFEQDDTKTAPAFEGRIVSWVGGDKVHYYTADDGDVREYTIEADASIATLTLERLENDTYYNLVYTGATGPAFTTKKDALMVFDGVRTAQDGTFGNANVSVARTVPKNKSGIVFLPITSLVKFTTAREDIKTVVLTGGGDETVAGNVSVDPTSSNPVAALSSGGSTSITVTFETAAAGTYYINVLPKTYGSGLSLSLEDEYGNTIGTVVATKSIDLKSSGKIINLGNIDTHIKTPEPGPVGGGLVDIDKTDGTW